MGSTTELAEVFSSSHSLGGDVPSEWNAFGLDSHQRVRQLHRVEFTAKIDVEVTAQTKNDGDEGSTTVMIHNPTSSLAFAVRLKVDRSSSDRVSREGPEDFEILPVLWQDNYFSLLPGETRQITAMYANRQKENHGAPFVEVEGWNVHRTIVKSQP